MVSSFLWSYREEVGKREASFWVGSWVIPLGHPSSHLGRCISWAFQVHKKESYIYIFPFSDEILLSEYVRIWDGMGNTLTCCTVPHGPRASEQGWGGTADLLPVIKGQRGNVCLLTPPTVEWWVSFQLLTVRLPNYGSPKFTSLTVSISSIGNFWPEALEFPYTHF